MCFNVMMTLSSSDYDEMRKCRPMLGMCKIETPPTIEKEMKFLKQFEHHTNFDVDDVVASRYFRGDTLLR